MKLLNIIPNLQPKTWLLIVKIVRLGTTKPMITAIRSLSRITRSTDCKNINKALLKITFKKRSIGRWKSLVSLSTWMHSKETLSYQTILSETPSWTLMMFVLIKRMKTITKVTKSVQRVSILLMRADSGILWKLFIRKILTKGSNSISHTSSTRFSNIPW